MAACGHGRAASCTDLEVADRERIKFDAGDDGKERAWRDGQTSTDLQCAQSACAAALAIAAMAT
jgi:hypothetical protein